MTVETISVIKKVSVAVVLESVSLSFYKKLEQFRIFFSLFTVPSTLACPKIAASLKKSHKKLVLLQLTKLIGNTIKHFLYSYNGHKYIL